MMYVREPQLKTLSPIFRAGRCCVVLVTKAENLSRGIDV